MAYQGGCDEPQVSELILSPWPEMDTTAILFLKRACGAGWMAKDQEDDAVRLVGSMAAARVEREAPGAPQAVKNQAVIRYAGYMSQSDFGGIRREEIGDRNVDYVVNHSRAWITSGAKAVLAPWKPLGGVSVKHSSEAG